MKRFIFNSDDIAMIRNKEEREKVYDAIRTLGKAKAEAFIEESDLVAYHKNGEYLTIR